MPGRIAIALRRAIAVATLLGVLASIPLAGSASAGSAGTSGKTLLQTVRERGVLVVANTQASPPFSFLDTSGQVTGYDVDVAREVAKRIGVKRVEFVAGTFANFILGVQSRRFDMVISGQTITPDRLTQVAFSIPYEVNGTGLFVASSNTTIKGRTDLNVSGRSVAVTAGTTNEQQARGLFPNASIKTYPNGTLALQDVANGRADAVLISHFQGAFLAKNNNLAVKPIGGLVQSEINGMSFRRHEPTFKKAVDRAVCGMAKDGTLKRISTKWLGGLNMVNQLKNRDLLTYC